MGNFHCIDKNVRTMIYRKYLNREDREILRYLFTGKCKVEIDFIIRFSKEGNLKVLKWAEKLYGKLPCINHALTCASQYGHLNILENWKDLVHEGVLLYPACAGGQIKILEWYWKEIDNTVFSKYDYNLCCYALRNDQLEVFLWLRNKGINCPNYQIATSGSICGHLHIIKWAKDRGYYIDIATICYNSVVGGYLNVLQWLYENDKLPIEQCRKNALHCRHRKVLDWLETIN